MIKKRVKLLFFLGLSTLSTMCFLCDSVYAKTKKSKSKYIIGGVWNPVFKSSVTYSGDIFSGEDLEMTGQAFKHIMKSGGAYFDYILPSRLGFGVSINYRYTEANNDSSSSNDNTNIDKANAISMVPLVQFSQSNEGNIEEGDVSTNQIICSVVGDTSLVSASIDGLSSEASSKHKYDADTYGKYLKPNNTKITESTLFGFHYTDTENGEIIKQLYFPIYNPADTNSDEIQGTDYHNIKGSIDLGYVYNTSKELDVNFRVLYDFYINKSFDIFLVGRLNWIPTLSDEWSTIKASYVYKENEDGIVDVETDNGYIYDNTHTTEFSNSFGIGADVTARYNFGSVGLVGGLGLDKQFKKDITGDKSDVPAINDGVNQGIGTLSSNSMSRSAYSINGILGVSFSF